MSQALRESPIVLVPTAEQDLKEARECIRNLRAALQSEDEETRRSVGRQAGHVTTKLALNAMRRLGRRA